MKPEDKELLLKDLCARLPYKCKCKASKGITHWHKLTLNPETIDKIIDDYYDEIKPYLRPMSSMTLGEKKEYKSFFRIGEYTCGGSLYGEEYEYIDADSDDISQPTSLIDWLNAHHFDFRGLIPMGLALKAPDGMYNKEESEKGSEIPIPKTVDEAVKTLAKIVSKEDRDYLLENGAISVHNSMGRWIRNEWGLWTDSELKNELKKKGFEHPDDMSNYIIEEFIKYWNK